MPKFSWFEPVVRLFRRISRTLTEILGSKSPFPQPLPSERGWNFLSLNANVYHLCHVQLIDASVGFAVGEKGAILKTEDGGNTWQAKVSGTENDLHGVHFINQSFGAVVGSNNTILWTFNGGDNWSDLRISSSPEIITIRDVFLIDSNKAVIVGGVEVVGAWGDFPHDIEGRISWTDDGGETWHPSVILAEAHNLSSVQFTDSTTGVAAGGITSYFNTSISDWRSAATLLQTTDEGRTWVPLDIPPSQQDRPFYDLSFYDGGHGIAVGGWHATPPIRTFSGVNAWSPTEYEWDGCGLDVSVLTSVSCFDANTAVAVGGGNEAAGIYRYVQTDPESPWERIDYGTYPNLQGVSFAKDSNFGVAVGRYSTVLRSDDSGQTWTEGTIEGISSLPVPVTEFEKLEDAFFIDANTGFIVGWFGTLLRTSDGGQSWIRLPDVTNYGLTCIHFQDVQNGLIGGWSSCLQQTDDGGITWKKFQTTDLGETWTPEVGAPPPPQHRYFPKAIHFCDAVNGFSVGLDSFTRLNKPVILQTMDGGATWSKLALPADVLQMESVALEDVHCFDSQTLVAVGRRRREVDTDQAAIILRTVDGGASWSIRTDEFEDPFNLINDLYAVHFVDTSTGFAVGGVDAILRTDDGGITWNRLGTEEPRPIGRFHGVHFIDGNTGWVVGYFSTTTGGYTLRGAIYRTADGGQSWTEQHSSTGTFGDMQFNDVFFVDVNTGIVLGDKGVVLRTESAGI